ncbi:hypothetical protein HYR99_27380 [Candidatus Poribacteria bacterium]|nr:hypothetical protein [Candidatus Poribacteria bacterium]
MALSKVRIQRVMGKMLALLEREFASKYRDTKVQVSKGWGDTIHIIVVMSSPVNKKADPS